MDLNVLLIQPSIIWKDIEANLNKYYSLISNAKSNLPHLIVLPEMFSTGFCLEPAALPENSQEITMNWMKACAKEFSALIVGSIPYKEGDRYYNSLFCISPDQSIMRYNKRHLFSIAGEDKQYTPGSESILIDYLNWKINPLICFDLRFPVWSRNREDGYDTLLYVANWPAKRNSAWETLLQARAIENQAYVLGVNRIGRDDNDIEYVGNSMVISPEGAVLHQLGNREGIIECTLNKDKLLKLRKQFPVLREADSFEIK